LTPEMMQQLQMIPPEQAQQMMQQLLVPPNKKTEMLDPLGKPILQPNPETGQMEPVMYEITVNPFDDHAVHVEEHQNFQKSQEYELLSPEIQKIIQDHVDEHKMEILKERNAIQADAAMKQEPEGEETVPPRELEPSSNGQQGY